MYLNSCGTRKATAEEVNMVIAIEPVHAAIMAPSETKGRLTNDSHNMVRPVKPMASLVIAPSMEAAVQRAAKQAKEMVPRAMQVTESRRPRYNSVRPQRVARYRK
ncbi:MAG: hypothetical protein CMI31_01225 [Opitutae bacterium]|nr:hypothetical protein [Opitutae bacterium]